MTTIPATAAKQATNVVSTFFGENNTEKKDANNVTAIAEQPIETTGSEEKKPEVTAKPKAEKKAKAQPKNAKKVKVPVQATTKKATETKAKKVKPKKVEAKDKKITEYTLKDAFTRLRDAGKESKSLSGTVKIILAFWKDGYSDAFAAIGLSHKDITVPNIQKLWHKDLMLNGVFAYKLKVTVYTTDLLGDRTPDYDNEGNVKKETILKPFSNNFSPKRLFDALYYTQYEKKACVFQQGEKKAA